MPLSRHDPRFRQMADKIFGLKGDVEEKKESSDRPISARAGAISKGRQVIRVPKAQRVKNEEEAMQSPQKDFERLVKQCDKNVQDQFNAYSPPIKSKLQKAFEVWKKLPEDTFFAGKIEREMESRIKHADRFVIMLRQVDLLEDAGRGMRGAILYRKKDVDDIKAIETMVKGSSKMTAWSSRAKHEAKAEEGPSDPKLPSEGPEESSPEIEETAFEPSPVLSLEQQGEIKEATQGEPSGEQSPVQPMDVDGKFHADQFEEQSRNPFQLKTTSQADSDEFDEMRDEWRVFQRLFPNLGKKDFHRISFKNRFGEKL